MVDKVLFTSDKQEWLTPKEIIGVVELILGSIDLDPCAEEGPPFNVPATFHFTKQDDGLSLPWLGRVYMNPPYGHQIGRWVQVLRHEVWVGAVKQAIALVPARTDTRWWRTLTEYASAVCFVNGRLRFVGAPAGAPFPSALVALGVEPGRMKEYCKDLGEVWRRL